MDLATEAFKVINHYLPNFLEELRQVKDVRHPSYITYPAELMLVMRIFAAMTAIKSMREMTAEFNCTQFIENLKRLLGERISALESLPYWETINNFLCSINPQDIQQVIYQFIRRLIRMRSFENGRIKDKYWQVLIDGTHLCTFKERHCDQCLTRVHNRGTAAEYTEYYHYVLEAKLYICPELVLTIDTEFVENYTEKMSKQDCELKAFKRLTQRMKENFKRLPICLTLDSLYACEPVFALCRQNNWHYLIRFKEGSIPSVAKEYDMLKALEPSQCLKITNGKTTQVYSFVNDIAYRNSQLNILDLVETEVGKNGKEKTRQFIFATDLPVTTKNAVELMRHCRARWRIENEGFNCQKNLGYYLGHLFSKDPTGMKNHYLLIQIGHMLVQLVMFGLKGARELYKTTHQLRTKLLQSCQWRPLTEDIAEKLKKVIYVGSYVP